MKACIFDLDGTLLDSMGVWEKIDHEFFKKRGFAAPADYKDAVAALSFPETAAYTIKRFSLTDSVEDLMQEWKDIAEYAYGNTVPLKPGAKEYLSSLRERGAKLAIATSSTPALYEPALLRHGIFGWFDAICTSEEAGRGKSYPDVFLLAAKKLGVQPCDCVVFEDILTAVQTAKNAGFSVYGVYDKSSEADWEQIKQIADKTIMDWREI
jgi:HAD superfamily hydrolase (TIGR01509 family)